MTDFFFESPSWGLEELRKVREGNRKLLSRKKTKTPWLFLPVLLEYGARVYELPPSGDFGLHG